MPEQLNNLASTTLASGYTAGAGSISVTSATGFPSGGTFTLTIRDSTTKAVKLLFRVTSVAGTTFTGASEGADANASAGDLVDGTIISVAALQQLRKDADQLSTYAGRLAASLAGNLQLYSDGMVLCRDSGSTLDPFGPVNAFTDPNIPSWSWLRQNSGVVTPAGGGIYLSIDPAHADSSLISRIATVAPTAPYSLTAAFVFMAANTGSQNQTVGIFLRDSGTAKILLLKMDLRSFLFEGRWSSPTVSVSETGLFLGQNMVHYGTTLWLRMRDDSTNMLFQVSGDGVNWLTGLTESRTAYLPGLPDGAGFFVQANNGNFAMAATLLSFAIG